MFASGKKNVGDDLSLADLDWQNSVLGITDNTAVPPTEVTGDRYLLDAAGGGVHANWDGAAVNDVVQFNGSVWEITYVAAGNEGGAAWIEDLDANYIWDGTTWAAFSSTLLMARIPGSTYSTVQHMQNVFHSVGWISEGAILNDGDGTITVEAGTGLIRATDDAVAEMVFFDWLEESGANVALADNDISYIYVEYNGGSPRVVATLTERTDFNTNILLARISREGTELHINATDQHTVGDHANSMIRRLKGVQPYGHVAGTAVLSEIGTRNINITAGIFWRGLTEFGTSALNTSGADRFSYYYNNGSWQKVTTVAQISNTEYNDFGTGLAPLANNRYGVHWVYLEADDDDVAVVYGLGSYTLAQAEDAQAPSAVPLHLEVEGILMGKIIVGKDDSVFTQVQNLLGRRIVGSIATEHNATAGLQGGAADEYYHRTAAEEAGVFPAGKTISFAEEVDNGDSGTSDTIDWTVGNKQKSTLTGSVTFTFSPEPAGPCNLILKLIQGGSGGYTVTWPADVKWSGGTTPTLSTGVGEVDLVSFYYDGTDFYGQAAAAFA